ncbi:heavy metal-responsive transcriptional regulator [Paenarthrobacter sp. Z7-10]|uniref:heavy metal-responsive transcriptional regulator n=1 Tax=Paenarthrobacter sp. Z7-10 TaxID=2787635 RepID=UPI0022A9044D|nr:heavy metal-responsive transcriptional regulator [Paenarthrobacter sp. Z7-10]
MRIGVAAAAVGMTTKALRFYEEQGLLSPAERSANGYRDYPEEILGNPGFIRRGKDVGLALAEIHEILRIRGAGQAPCTHVADQLASLDEQIVELTTLRASVAELHAAVAAGNPDECDAQQVCSYL